VADDLTFQVNEKDAGALLLPLKISLTLRRPRFRRNVRRKTLLGEMRLAMSFNSAKEDSEIAS